MAHHDCVVTLAAGPTTQADLPFTSFTHVCGAAVDFAGNVFVADQDNQRVVELSSGLHRQSDLPFVDLQMPFGVGVDAAGTVYATHLAELPWAETCCTEAELIPRYAPKLDRVELIRDSSVTGRVIRSTRLGGQCIRRRPPKHVNPWTHK
jgi:hypothetical protein